MQGETGALIKELAKHLEEKKCMIVVDDLSTVKENFLPILDKTSRIVVTTRERELLNIVQAMKKKTYTRSNFSNTRMQLTYSQQRYI
jgi:hypothetical protein